jgi:glycosyltransferase involved in cell wall biosynthesis
VSEKINKISVCMATYNGEKFLREQIESILIQLTSNDELIISDDGSIDGTVEIIKSFGSKVTLIQNTTRKGVVKNFESALKTATGDLIFLSDQDDKWLPGRVQAMCKCLQTKHLVLANAKLVDAQLAKIGPSLFERLNVHRGFVSNLFKNSYTGCCMAFRRELLDVCLPFPAITPIHDWLIGLVAEAFFSIDYITEEYLLFRRHPDTESQTGFNSTNSLLFKIKIRIRVIAAFFVVFIRVFKGK